MRGSRHYAAPALRAAHRRDPDPPAPHAPPPRSRSTAPPASC